MSFHRAPTFFCTSVATLMGGIALVVTVFTAYEQVVLHPLTVRDPDSLVALSAVNPGVNFVPPALSYPRFLEIERASDSFASVAAYSKEAVNWTRADGPAEQLRALRVSAGFFETLRMVAFHGRLFTEADNVENGPLVCVLSHDFWEAHWGRENIVGRRIQLDGRSVEVVGILAESLSVPWADRQVLLPRVFDDSGLSRATVMNGASYLSVVARLRSDVGMDAATDALRRVSVAYREQHPDRGDAANEVEVHTLTASVVGDRSATYRIMLYAVSAVLLIACLNVSALFISRLVSRQRETQVRQALGATSWHLFRQLLGEAAIVTGCAAVLGLFASHLLLAGATSALAPFLPAGVTLRLGVAGGAIGIFAALISTGVVAGLAAPRLRRFSTLASVAGSDRGGGTPPSWRRSQRLVTGVETAVSVVLLVGASLLTVSWFQLQRTSPGFDPSGVAAALVNLPSNRYPTPSHRRTLFLDLLEQLRAQPEIDAAAVVFGLPFHDENYAHTYVPSGQPIPPPSQRQRAGLRMVTEDYFAVMGIRFIEGHGFTTEQRAGGRPVCVINASLARRLAGAESALGKVILRGRNADEAFEVVGVVADVKTNGLRNDTPDEIFYPLWPAPRANVAIVARTSGDPAGLGVVFARVMQQIDSDQPLTRVGTMRDRFDQTIGPERLMADATGAFAIVAVWLAAVGLYALVAHDVAARTKEIGVRMALGAQRRTVVWSVLADSLRVVGSGVVVGLVAALFASGLLAAELYGVSTREPWVYLTVAGLFLCVGVVASLWPALRASRIDPLRSLNPR